MRRVLVTTTLAFVILLAPLPADAQQPAKVRQIGYLGGGVSSANVHLVEGFRQGLRELGWVESQNIAIAYRWAEGRYDQLPDLAVELVRLKVDVIVTAGTAGSLAAKQATKTIPIVMVSVGDPVGSGLVASLARPGGNITGTAFMSTEVKPKLLDLLKQAVPGATRVAVLWKPTNPSHGLALRTVEVVAQSLRVQLQLLEAEGPDEFDRAFAAMTRERAEALIVLLDTVFREQRTRIVDLAAKSRLPAIYEGREFVDAGGLMAYGPSVPDLFRRAATYVDKILKGAKPADLPVEQPTKFELFINLKTAKALGLTIPQTILIRADEVIQ
jgi:putative ABC transport system substrate-binding protein